jgi:hypothetical protein
MDSRDFVKYSVRDAIVIDAIRRAEIAMAMAMTSGFAINADGVQGPLKFESMIARLQLALFLLGGDMESHAPQSGPPADY